MKRLSRARLITILVLAATCAVMARESETPRVLVELSDRAARTARADADWLPQVVQDLALPDARLSPVFYEPRDLEHRNSWLRHGLHRWFRLDCSAEDPAKWIERVPIGGEVLSVSLDYPKTAQVEPNDYEIFDMWGLERMSCPAAWDVHHGESEIIITTIDTGCEILHEDLAANTYVNPGEDLDSNGVWDWTDNNGVDDDSNGFVDDLVGWDFVDQTYSETEQVEGEDYAPRDNEVFPDVHGHGTHVMGTAAAVTDNGVGVAAASWNVRALPLRAGAAVWDAGGDLRGRGFDSDFAPAIQYAVDMGARVISISFGGTAAAPVYALAVDYARDNNVLIFASAGNANSSIMNFPAALDGVVAVAATDRNDEKASFSSYGFWVGISAPGVSIFSTLSNNEHHPQDYVAWQGTSMASPNAASVAALTLSYQPEMTDDALEAVLLLSADNIEGANPGYIGQLGAGRANAELALQMAAGDSLPMPVLAGVDLEQSSGRVEIHWTFDPGDREDFLHFFVRRSDGENDFMANTFVIDTLPDYGYYSYRISANYEVGESLPTIATINWSSAYGLPFADDFEGSLALWEAEGTAEIVDDPVFAGDGALGVHSGFLEISGGRHLFTPVEGVDVEGWVNLAAYPSIPGLSGTAAVAINDTEGNIAGVLVDDDGSPAYFQVPPFPPTIEVIDPSVILSVGNWYKYHLTFHEAAIQFMLLNSEFDVLMQSYLPVIDFGSLNALQLGSFSAGNWCYFDNVRAHPYDGTFQHFDPVPPTGEPYAIVITGNWQLAEFEEFGVFDGELCVGATRRDPYALWDDWPIEVTVWQETATMEGFVPGDTIRIEGALSGDPHTWPLMLDSLEVGDGTFGQGEFTRLSLFAWYPADEQSGVVDEYALHQNFPNPFNPTTTISFNLASPGHTTLTVFDLLGREVATLVNSRLERGPHSVAFDASALPSGVYLYRIESAKFSAAKKMVLLK